MLIKIHSQRPGQERINGSKSFFILIYVCESAWKSKCGQLWFDSSCDSEWFAHVICIQINLLRHYLGFCLWFEYNLRALFQMIPKFIRIVNHFPWRHLNRIWISFSQPYSIRIICFLISLLWYRNLVPEYK